MQPTTNPKIKRAIYLAQAFTLLGVITVSTLAAVASIAALLSAIAAIAINPGPNFAALIGAIFFAGTTFVSTFSAIITRGVLDDFIAAESRRRRREQAADAKRAAELCETWRRYGDPDHPVNQFSSLRSKS